MQVFESAFAVLFNLRHSLFVDKVLFVVQLLPVDVSVLKDLDFVWLRHWEAWVKDCDLFNLFQQAFVLFEFNRKWSASQGKLVYKFNQLVAELPKLDVLLEDINQMVHRLFDPNVLELVLDTQAN